MNKLIFILFISINVLAKTTIIAVIDSGINKIAFKNYSSAFCDSKLHKDFTHTGLQDRVGHGTNVSGLIHKYAKNSNYCQVIIKYYDPTKLYNSMDWLIDAINYAVKLKVDIINISSNGFGENKLERAAIKRALDHNIIVVAAAGNDGTSLDFYPTYPASYDSRIIVVGNGRMESMRNGSSNYGKTVDVWEYGIKAQGEFGSRMTGTSQATAIYSGKLIGR